MRKLLILIFLLGSVGCSAPAWQWHDTQVPPRTDAESDLATCRSYAAAQYRPGVPTGDPYRQQQPADPSRLDLDPAGNPPGTETWHADREPYPVTNIRQESIHGVVVPYTGYPGDLDYHPEFLDALVEKCMAERGWHYGPPIAAASQ
jgi:hypothetical protein